MTDGRAGFFLPYRYAASVRPIAYPAFESLFHSRREAFALVLADIDRHAATLEAMRGPPPEPRFDQDWFARSDAAAAYVLVRSLRPATIVEIGCGHSTRFLARAVRDAGLATRIVCVDPAPRAKLDGLAVEHRAATVEEAGSDLAAMLAPGDVLFVDSSHVAHPGSDVDLILNRVVPALAAGVVVHLHDIFLPDPYPEAWAGRGYGEQMLVACLLQGGAFEVLFASHWVTTRQAALVAATGLARLPLNPGVPEASLWLRKLR